MSFLYNLVGHYILFAYRQAAVQQRMDLTLAAGEPNESDLFVLKMQASVYVQAPNTEFQHLRGTFSYEGKAYEMVKYRVYQDTLYIYCTQNIWQDALDSDLSDNIQRSIAGMGTTPDADNQLIKLLVKDYLSETAYLPTYIHPPLAQAAGFYLERFFPCFDASVDVPPPKA
ncbi:MAG: hypothetical protein SF053_05205 [Bacteroidia bacterium]|nr:hypothetical protein [Bacteroidia bacterium]